MTRAVWPPWTAWLRRTPSRGPATPRGHARARSGVAHDGPRSPTGSSTLGPVAPPEQEGRPDTGCNEDQPLRDEPVAEGQRPHVLPRGAQRTRKRREDRGAGPGNVPRFCPQLASPAFHALRAAEHTRSWVPELGPRSPAAGSCSGTRCPVSRANSLCKHRPRVHVALSPTSWQLRDWGTEAGWFEGWGASHSPEPAPGAVWGGGAWPLVLGHLFVPEVCALGGTVDPCSPWPLTPLPGPRAL